MASLFRKRIYMVYFGCTGPDGVRGTADCLTEALTATQAKSQVLTSIKAQGFSHITFTDCREATEADLKQLADRLDADNSASVSAGRLK